tara:strand:+ start:322 stop:591 length:270 start_codon:yes stop_codon:yes gene_type:complete
MCDQITATVAEPVKVVRMPTIYFTLKEQFSLEKQNYRVMSCKINCVNNKRISVYAVTDEGGRMATSIPREFLDDGSKQILKAYCNIDVE